MLSTATSLTDHSQKDYKATQYNTALAETGATKRTSTGFEPATSLGKW